MSSRTRWVWGSLVGVGGSIGVVLIILQFLGPKVDVVEVSRRLIVQDVVVSGRVLPRSRIPIGSLVPGLVTQVAVKEGDHVNPGDLLVKLDDAEAQAGLKLAKAGLDQARARLRQLQHVTSPVARGLHRQADANLEFARMTYERLSAMAKQDGVPPAQLDEAKRTLAIAQSQHDTTETQAVSAGPKGADHKLSVAAYAQAAATVAQAEVRVAQSKVVALVPAVVLTRSVEPGEITQPGRPLLVLSRDGKTLLSAQMDEKDLAALRLSQPARASADAFGKDSFVATVSYIAPSVDPQRGTVEVRFDVPTPPEYLRPDMTVSINIEVGRRQDAVVVPTDAVLDLGSASPWVWLLRDRHVEKRSVQLGLRGDGFVEILSGLGEHDTLVLPAGSSLKLGRRVRATIRTGS